MIHRISRRRFLAATAGGMLAATATASGGRAAAEDDAPAEASSPAPRTAFPISLNSSTLRGHKLPLRRVVEIAAAAGYDGIEPWPDDIARHLEKGGTLADIRQQIDDAGLRVTGAIAFFRWMVDDETARRAAHEEARRLLEQLAAIGATHVAAPPSGDVADVSLLAAADRYRALLDLAEPFGVIPAVEVWGFARNCRRLGEAALVAMEADHPKACVLPDVYHLVKGGSPLSAVRFLNGTRIGGFHFNDVPAGIERDALKDSDRVYPGDGATPLGQLLRDLRDIGYSGPLSIELFNPQYYKEDPEVVARTALAKTRAVMEEALAK